jgi:hypothetical protein
MQFMRARSIPTFLPIIGLLYLAANLQADVIRIDFDSTVRMVIGDVPPDASLGSRITGHIQIDAATLPALVTVGETGGMYSYFDRNPGFSMQVSMGQRLFAFDSLNASQEGGPTPATSLEPGYASLIFVLREQGNPFTMTLALFDYSSPLTLLSGPRFPDDVDPYLTGLEFCEFSYANLDNSILVSSRVTSVSMSVVPEPSTSAFAALVGLGLMWRKGRAMHCRPRGWALPVPLTRATSLFRRA